jgi:ABC-2 type transport system ATP-binding protein/lipopolysaccharide transport system ATP-binding protein
VASRVPDLNLAVSLQTLRGVQVLDEALADHARRPSTSRGLRGAPHDPAAADTGDYSVGVWLGTDLEVFAWVEQAVAIHLEGASSGRAERVVQLDLPWEVSRSAVTG